MSQSVRKPLYTQAIRVSYQKNPLVLNKGSSEL